MYDDQIVALKILTASVIGAVIFAAVLVFVTRTGGRDKVVTGLYYKHKHERKSAQEEYFDNLPLEQQTRLINKWAREAKEAK